MSTDSIPPIHPGEMPPPPEALSSFRRLRESAADSIFFISRTFPKVLTLRSTPRAWTAFRLLLGVSGAGLVVLPLSLWNAWAFAPVGLALFLLAERRARIAEAGLRHLIQREEAPRARARAAGA